MRSRIFHRDGVSYLLPDPTMFESAEVQLAIGLRNEATLSGRCSVCGAAGRISVFEHGADCPAGNDRLLELLREEGEIA